MQRRHFLQTGITCSLGLVLHQGLAATQAELQRRRRRLFDEILFDNTASGSRLSEVLRLKEGSYLAISRPEVRPINPSPWYAFAIESKHPCMIELTIRVDASQDGRPLKASRPWLSHDGVNYIQLEEENWNREGTDCVATLQLPAGRLHLAAWKPKTLEAINAWTDRIAALSFVSHESIGLSYEGRPIRQLAFGAGAEPRWIFVLGGQHPPEITGNIGLEAFVEALCASDELAGEFRRHFRTVVIPMINPDGKHHGHWRTTLGGVDPNRDWFDQSQPEVQAVVGHLSGLAKSGTVCYGTDFHSTNRDFVYVESRAAAPGVSEFTRAWLEKAEALMDAEKVVTVPGRSMNPCSREWLAQRFDCPAYTREFRYDQAEEEVRRKAGAEARAMMELLIEQHA